MIFSSLPEIGRSPLPRFVCQTCGQAFSVSDEVLARYPGWTPKVCLRCKKVQRASAAAWVGRSTSFSSAKKRRGTSVGSSHELDLPVEEVLRRFHDGPLTGVFTDGAAHPNPGPGGWGAVYVVDNEIVGERFDHEPHTTNNRMELMALREGLALVPVGTSATIYTDSELCVKTFTQWVQGWKARGWKRKGGPIKNLALVQQVHEHLCARPELRLEWIAAHNGYRWNEYADALATAYRRIHK